MALSADAPRGRRLYAEAVATAGRSGDRGAQRAVLLNAHLGHEHPGDQRPAARREWLAGDSDVERVGGQFLGFGLALIDADRTAIDRSLAALRALTPVVRQRTRTGALLQIGACAMLCGDIERADALPQRRWKRCWRSTASHGQRRCTPRCSSRFARSKAASPRLAGPVAVLRPRHRASSRGRRWLPTSASPPATAMVAAALDALAGDQLALAETPRGPGSPRCCVGWRGTPAPPAGRAAADRARTVRRADDVERHQHASVAPASPSSPTCSASRAVDLHLATAAALLDRLRAPHLWWRELDGLR